MDDFTYSEMILANASEPCSYWMLGLAYSAMKSSADFTIANIAFMDVHPDNEMTMINKDECLHIGHLQLLHQIA